MISLKTIAPAMTKRTVTNEVYKGLVESFAIPADLCERDGKKFASFGSVVPIHCCSAEEVSEKSAKTHHYCDIFTEETLAPLGELVYVRLDENTAEKVFINRAKRLLLTSSDGRLAQWRCAPSFESANHYLPGTPIVNMHGALVSLVTARKGNHYAVSTFEGDGGYFETSLPWAALPAAGLVYGERCFPSRDELLRHLADLPPASSPAGDPRPTLFLAGGSAAGAGAAAGAAGAGGGGARLTLTAPSGRQIAHMYVHGVVSDVEYL